jgi:hypothetical protein
MKNINFQHGKHCLETTKPLDDENVFDFFPKTACLSVLQARHFENRESYCTSHFSLGYAGKLVSAKLLKQWIDTCPITLLRVTFLQTFTPLTVEN